MQKFCCFTLALLITTTAFGRNNFYHKISRKQYGEYRLLDTMISNEAILLCKGNKPPWNSWAEVLLVRTNREGKEHYFQLEEDTYYLGGDSFICYAPPFLATTEDGGFQKNGLWVYTHFEHGARYYKVDSLPENENHIPRPTGEGIYLFRNGKLELMSQQQSEEQLSGIAIDGFYFFPNTGRMFERHKLGELE